MKVRFPSAAHFELADALYYHLTDDEVEIVAVADLRRDPARWEHLL